MEQDYVQTIKAFFASVVEFTTHMASFYKDSEEKNSIYDTVNKIKDVEKQVLKLIEERTNKPYDARVLNDMVWKLTTVNYSPFAFMKPNSVDNSPMIAYRDVLRGIGEYYGLPIQQKEKLLRPLKKWYYTVSTNKMKNFIYPFLPLKHFVLKDQTKGK